ncbi:hypothetical protein BU17DRAFT_69427 [Hysterangium stoloniferum]|nr:hypothetical protein BU17DRAFT_69427 [Hysterangium stoloniferum]
MSLVALVIDSSGPPVKNLAAVEEKEKDMYEFMTTVMYWPCYGEEASHPEPEKSVQEEGLYQWLKLLGCAVDVIGEHSIEYTCPRCDAGLVAGTRAHFATFPDLLPFFLRIFPSNSHDDAPILD